MWRVFVMCVMLAVCTATPAQADSLLTCNEEWQMERIMREVHLKRKSHKEAVGLLNEEVYNISREEFACGYLDIMSFKVAKLGAMLEIGDNQTIVVLEILIDVIRAPGPRGKITLHKMNGYPLYVMSVETTDQLQRLLEVALGSPI
jgi:hypothetical protein